MSWSVDGSHFDSEIFARPSRQTKNRQRFYLLLISCGFHGLVNNVKVEEISTAATIAAVLSELS